MATSYMSVHVQCPFYKGDDRKKIVCEGIDDKCNTHHQYENKEQKMKRMEQYCTKDYKKCEFYKTLAGKYQK